MNLELRPNQFITKAGLASLFDSMSDARVGILKGFMSAVLFVSVMLIGTMESQGQDTNFQFIQNADSASIGIKRIFIAAGNSNNCSEVTLTAESLAQLATVSLGNRYTILERKYLDMLLEEQRLSLSGLLLEETTIAAGCLQGSEAIVFCSVECINGKSVLTIKLIDCAEGVQHWIALYLPCFSQINTTLFDVGI